MAETHPELFEHELKNAEKLRAEERATLRHRGGSKWSRNLLMKGKNNPEIRNALMESIRISQNLKDNKPILSDDEVPSETLDQSVDDETKKKREAFISSTINDLSDNPWFSKTNETSVPETDKPFVYFTPKTPITKKSIKKSQIDSKVREEEFVPSVHIDKIKAIVQDTHDLGNVESNVLAESELIPSSLFEINPAVTDDIAEAFAGDDIIEEFVEENVETDVKSNVDDGILPGWGSWSGPNLNPTPVAPIPQKRKFPCVDKLTPHAIVKKQKRLEFLQHVMTKLPPNFRGTEEDFGHSISQPIGQLWNTQRSFLKRIKPKVENYAGNVIKPIDPDFCNNKKNIEVREIINSLPPILKNHLSDLL